MMDPPRPSPRQAAAQTIRLRDGSSVGLRVARAVDLRLLAANFSKLTPEDVHQRFFEYLSNFPGKLAHMIARAGRERQLALLAVPPPDATPSDDVYGLVQLVDRGEGTDAEYAIAVRHDWQGRGLGWALTAAVLDQAHRRQIPRIFAYVLPENERMTKMLREFGFSIGLDPDDARILLATRRLEQPVQPASAHPQPAVSAVARAEISAAARKE